MDKHEMFMKKALEEACLAEEEGEIPVGAVVRPASVTYRQ